MAATWFILMSGLTLLALALGCWLGGRSPGSARLTAMLGLVLLAGWVYLIHWPALAVRLIPPSILSYLEGTAGAPLFMAILGAALTMSQQPRQKRLVRLAILFGFLYLLNGGVWMLQTTPSSVLGQDLPEDGAFLQTQDYSCAAAACATAMGQLGLPTTEAQMAELTQTRPGSGTTLIRTLDGLERRLAGTPYRPQLLQPTYEGLMRLPVPIVTPLQLERSRRHMVTLLRLNRHGAWMVDPMVGEFFMFHEDLRAAYIGQVIIFVRE